MTNDPNWRLPEVPAFTLESFDSTDGDPLPQWVRGDSGNRTPALRWSGAPESTKSYVLTVFDAGACLPPEAVVMANELRVEEFTGAAPPPGDGPHRYFFTVSALDVESLDLPAGATPAVLGFMLRGHIIGRAQLMGTAETPSQ